MVSSELNYSGGIWSRYSGQAVIGQGVYGKVHRAINRETGLIVAIKETTSDSDGILATTMRELSMLRQCDHRNVVKLIEADQCMETFNVYMVIEYADMDLHHFVYDFTDQLQFYQKSFLYQMLSGVNEIHMRAMIHRDIKPANILVCKAKPKGYILKIADFGLGRRIGPLTSCFSPEVKKKTNKTQTMLYRAPEVYHDVPRVFSAIDIWSIGCVFAEILRNGEPLFKGTREIELLQSIFETIGYPNDRDKKVFGDEKCSGDRTESNLKEIIFGLDNNGFDLLDEMLALNPGERISALEALRHNYFSDFKPDLTSVEVRQYENTKDLI